MKMTNKQQEEVNFLCNKFRSFEPTKKEIEEYIEWTVNGNKGMESNRLFQAKRMLDMTIKMWREDLGAERPLLFIEELLEGSELECPYLHKIIDSLVKGLRRKG